jgi:hypothetical protein
MEEHKQIIGRKVPWSQVGQVARNVQCAGEKIKSNDIHFLRKRLMKEKRRSQSLGCGTTEGELTLYGRRALSKM